MSARLMPARLNLRDLSKPGLLLQKVLDGLTRLRWLLAVAMLAAVAVLVLHHQDIWNRQLNALSSTSPAQNKLDAELRADLGGNDMRYVASFSAPDQESALQLAERTRRVLQQLNRQNVIGGFHTPDELLPSIATQRARQAALPPAGRPHHAWQQHCKACRWMPSQLQGFVSDVTRAQQQALLSRASLHGSAASVLLDSMLIKRPGSYLVLMPLRPASGENIALDKVRAALAAQQLGQVTVIDLLEETTAIFDSYTHEALLFSSLGSLAILLLLGVTCGWLQAVRVTIPLGCAVLCTVALLDACGIQLTILHLVGLLLVVAIGSNYALFFANKQQLGSAAEQRQVEVSLVVANLATVTSFGLLGSSSVPVLSYIGSTVAIGALLALVFAAMMARMTRVRCLTDAWRAGQRADSLLVLLPPAKASLEDLLAQGMVAAVRARGLPLDIVLADVGYQQVLAGTVADSLHQAVLQPALAQGYRNIWLAGISLGAFNALHYAAVYAEHLAGISCWLPIPVRPTSCRKSALLAGRRPGRMLRPACRTNDAGGTGWLLRSKPRAARCG
jgi:predicted exporter